MLRKSVGWKSTVNVSGRNYVRWRTVEKSIIKHPVSKKKDK